MDDAPMSVGGGTSGAARLDKLWESRIAVIVAGLENEESPHEEIANAASHIAADYKGRFLIELLQNASDQAGKAGRKVATVVIVRTRKFFALINEGQPFDEQGVRSITSLALTTKNAEESLGNKGVGFKSVFRVSSAPELYSSSGSLHGVRDSLAWAFRLDTTPLAYRDVRDHAARLIERCLADRPRAREVVAARAKEKGFPDDASFVLDAMGKAASWKFPLHRSAVHLDELATALELEPEWLATMQTVIVLPLKDEPDVQQIVDLALDDVRNPATILFLPIVAELVIHDRVKGTTERIHRRSVGVERALGRGARLRQCEISITENGKDSRPPERFWICERTMGKAVGISEEQALAERERISEATAMISGKGWETVRHAHVAVALAQPNAQCALPSAEGKFCIGLPTRLSTGLPVWIDAHFHGDIPRTNIDFGVRYNELLFDEALQMTSALLAALKDTPSLDARRAVTLAMRRSAGRLADCVWRAGGLAHGDVVLGADGSTFLSPRSIATPRAADLEMLSVLTGGSDDEARASGFVLAERGLMEHARALIDDLVEADGGKPLGDAGFLERRDGLPSLLERAARRARDAGSTIFWTAFLEWTLSRFSVQQLASQKILPVGIGDLASQDDRVFIEPFVSTGDTQSSNAADQIEVSELHDAVRRHLRFIDETVLPARVEGRRDLTALMQRLSPESGAGLVARPDNEQLLRNAVVPRLAEVARSPEQRPIAFELLRFAIHLVKRFTNGVPDRLRATVAAVVVPTGTAAEDASWTPCGEVYLGPGWVDDQRNDLLQAAYGGRPGARLVPWRDFAAAVAEENDEARLWWREGMRVLGIASTPRLLEHGSLPVVRASNGALKSVGTECPIAAARSFWPGYVAYLQTQPMDRGGRQYFVLSKVAWIDGLEVPSSREAIVRMLLESHDEYFTSASAELRRVDGYDKSPVRSLWSHAIASGNWPVIPAERSGATYVVEPSRVYALSAEERRKASTQLLLSVPFELEPAHALLAKLGVSSFAGASIERIVSTLHEYGEFAAEAMKSHAVPARALLGDLWNAVRVHCAQNPQSAVTRLRGLVTRPVPLLRGRDIETVDLRNVVQVFVNDDPVRGAFVDGLESALQLPTTRDVRALVSVLRALVGESRIVTASEAAVNTGFSPDGNREPMKLVDYLDESFKNNDVVTDLGLLYAYPPEGTEVDLRGDAFARFRTVLESTKVVWGTFARRSADGRDTHSFFERTTSTLQVDFEDPIDVVEATWPIAGGAKHLWTAYAKHLREGSVEQFLRVGEAEREGVAAALQRGHAVKLARLRSAALAIFRARELGRLTTFKSQWPDRSRNVDDLDRWLGGGLRDVLLRTLDIPEEEAATVEVLSHAKVSVPDWQRAREELGLPQWELASTRAAWKSAAETFVIGVRSEVARLFAVDLAAAEAALTTIARESPPKDLLTQQLDFDGVVVHVLARAQRAFADAGGATKMGALVSRLDALMQAPPEGRRKLLDELGTDREKQTYRTDPEQVRSAQATNARDDLLRVIVALAKKRDEEVDGKMLVGDTRVAAFSHGYWANRFGVLAAVRHALESIAPSTTRALSSENAFGKHVPWRSLWERFPELGPVPDASPTPTRPPRTIDLLGSQHREDQIATVLAQGSSGAIGQRVIQLVDPTIDLRALATRPRGGVVLPTPREPGERGRGGSGGNYADRQADRDLNGRLGEIFVYELLRALTDGFDEYAWKSRNRTAYGFTGDGDDDLGYDFGFVDTTGVLSGRTQPTECFVEVKATSGDGTEPFPLSVAEWSVAQECHLTPGKGCYVILRVARVRGDAFLSDVIRDPVQMRTNKHLEIVEKDLWAYVARAQP